MTSTCLPGWTVAVRQTGWHVLEVLRATREVVRLQATGALIDPTDLG
ncbi:MAG: hypothetical protein KF817_13340 [Phycisphaeraceae bacterium]|nr:hypothetical protein [Phycisphaeraceae bacterium]